MSQFVTGSSLTSARAAAAWVEAILVGELGRRREVTVRETVLRLLTCPELGKDRVRGQELSTSRGDQGQGTLERYDDRGRAYGDRQREVGPAAGRLLPRPLPGGDGVPVARVKQFTKLAAPAPRKSRLRAA